MHSHRCESQRISHVIHFVSNCFEYISFYSSDNSAHHSVISLSIPLSLRFTHRWLLLCVCVCVLCFFSRKMQNNQRRFPLKSAIVLPMNGKPIVHLIKLQNYDTQMPYENGFSPNKQTKQQKRPKEMKTFKNLSIGRIVRLISFSYKTHNNSNRST